jgi:hypothetical protein
MGRQVESGPLIILSPPRSYSSLVCAMIGQHPRMYAFPELNLFVTDTVGELLDLPNAGDYTAGVTRAISELIFGGFDASSWSRAGEWIASRRHMKGCELFAQLVDLVRPLTAVERSPRTAMSRVSIERAIRAFPQARFLHLTRHPVNTVRSFLKAHQPNEARTRVDNEAPRFYAQLWVHVHQSILEFTQQLHPSRTMRIRAEDMCLGPDAWLLRITQWLGVSSAFASIDAMKHPERSVYARPGPAGFGADNDCSFLVDPWLRQLERALPLEFPWPLGDALLDKAVRLAKALGYE